MTTSSDFDRHLRTWLEQAGPASIRDDVIDGALDTASRTAQRRTLRQFAGGRAWPRTRSVGAIGRVGFAFCLVGVVVAGVAIASSSALLLNPRVDGPPALVAGAPAATPGGGSSQAAVNPAPPFLPGTWLREGNASTELDGRMGPSLLRLVVSADALRVMAGNLRNGDLFATTGIADGGPATLTLRTGPGATEPSVAINGTEVAGCKPGDGGTFSWSVSVPQSPVELRGVERLRLQVLEEECHARAAILAGTWTRSLIGDHAGGTGVVPVSLYGVRATLPDGRYTTEGSESGWTIVSEDGSTALDVLVDPRVALDSCHALDGSAETASSTDGFIEALAANEDLSIARALPFVLPNAPGRALAVRYTDSGGCAERAIGWQSGTSFHVDPETTLVAVDLAPHVLIIVAHGDDTTRQSILMSLEVLHDFGAATR